MGIAELVINQKNKPIGLSDKDILFSWKIDNGFKIKQKKYELDVSLDREFKKIIWHQNEWTDESVHIKYDGPKLVEKTSYYVRVRIVDNKNKKSEWSAVQQFETGLLENTSWRAVWVTTPCQVIDDADGSFKPFTGLKTFDCLKKIKNARLTISAMGIYSAYLNGEKIGEDYFTPGWTDYNKHIQFQTYDVTDQLRKTNELIVNVAEGWFSGYLGWEKEKNTYGSFNAFIAQLEINYEDGTKEIIKSDKSWSEIDNKWLKSDLYNGEKQDLTTPKIIKGKMQPLTLSTDYLTPQINEPVRKQEWLKPAKLFRDNENRLILDLGQNMVGWVKCSVTGKKGQKVSLTHAEVLDKNGNFYRENIREADQKDDYILTGERDLLEPSFTYHGFRYVHLENFPETVKLDDFTGVVLYSGMKATGTFETSHPLLNQLQRNIVWGQKGNFFDVPTDCPQRDERLGWTADAQLFLPTASFNMNTLQFFKKWLKDMRAAQLREGEIPVVVPDVLKGVFANNASKTTAAWGDAATIIPWELYQHYGDVTFLEDNYSMMKRWVNYIREQGVEELLWDTGMQLGDWLALDAKEGSFLGATDETLLATCYFAYSAEILAKTAKILGNYPDFKEYNELFSAIKNKIGEIYFSKQETLLSDTQTAHIIVLMFRLYPENAEKKLVNRLVELIQLKGNHLDTGFIGTPYICKVLSDFGQTELAYQLLFNEDLPSWLYQVKMGATTIWEHFDGIKKDGTFWDDSMNSFNHYAYGSVGNWMYETIGGIQIKQPGYKESIIAPKLSQHLTSAKTSLNTPYGFLKSDWTINDQKLTLRITIPSNTEAEIILPSVANPKAVLNEITKEWEPLKVNDYLGNEYKQMASAKFKLHQKPSKKIKLTHDDLLICVGSGEYEINYKLKDWMENNGK